MRHRTSFCTFCDDVRYELGNKVSLMGIYAATMVLQAAPPIVIPKLCLAIWVIFDPKDIPSFVNVRLLTPPNKLEAISINTKIEKEFITSIQKEDTISVSIHFQVPIWNLNLQEAGFLEVMVDTGEGEERVGRLDVSFSAANIPPTPGSPDGPAPPP